MKKIFYFIGLSFFSTGVFATQSSPLTIVNHYDKPLTFVVSQNPQVVPSLQKNVTLQPNSSFHAKVINSKQIPREEGYISVHPLYQPFRSSNLKTAYFGVENDNGQTSIHGYISKGIAYSWYKNNTITFCTPQAYNKRCP